MEEILKTKWKKLDGTPITLPIMEAVEAVIVGERELGNQLKICIGTDSQTHGREFEFATVILFLRKGHGGYMYRSNSRESKKMTLKERMLIEVSRSIEIAYYLCPLFDKYNTEMEIHADINTNPRWGSNVALKEAMGYILGMGYAFKAKPEALAASYCADRVT